jgi:hypothetical protein
MSSIKNTLTVAIVALTVGSSGCASDEEEPPPPPSPETLFDTLPPPSPNKLRGVYMVSVEQSGGTVEIRIRFTDGYVVGAGKCTFKDASIEPIITGGSVRAAISSLDAATGKVTVPDLQFEKKTDRAICQAGLQGAEYDYKVEEDKLTLTSPKSVGELTFKKIGD